MSPDIARISTDAILLVGWQRVAGSLTAVALFAFQVAAFDVRNVREVDVLGLARVDQPLGLALRRHRIVLAQRDVEPLRDGMHDAVEAARL